MRKTTWTAACAAIAFGLTVGMATQQIAAAPRPATAAPTRPNSVSVIGCVEYATPAPTGTTGRSGPGAGEFVLVHAKMNPDDDASDSSAPGGASATPAGAPPVGTTGSASAAAAGTEYGLVGTSEALAARVGQRVEITGTIKDSAARSRDRSLRAPASLEVDAIRTLSDICAP